MVREILKSVVVCTAWEIIDCTVVAKLVSPKINKTSNFFFLYPAPGVPRLWDARGLQESMPVFLVLLFSVHEGGRSSGFFRLREAVKKKG